MLDVPSVMLVTFDTTGKEPSAQGSSPARPPRCPFRSPPSSPCRPGSRRDRRGCTSRRRGRARDLDPFHARMGGAETPVLRCGLLRHLTAPRLAAQRLGRGAGAADDASSMGRGPTSIRSRSPRGPESSSRYENVDSCRVILCRSECLSRRRAPARRDGSSRRDLMATGDSRRRPGAEASLRPSPGAGRVPAPSSLLQRGSRPIPRPTASAPPRLTRQPDALTR